MAELLRTLPNGVKIKFKTTDRGVSLDRIFLEFLKIENTLT